MITVNLFAYEGSPARRVHYGSFRFDNGKLMAHPAKPEYAREFKFLLNDYDDINPDQEPEKWLRSLHTRYRSYALCASEPVES